MNKSHTQIHFFTSSAINYLPKVRLLAASVKRHHPEVRFHLALSDRVPSGLRLDEPLIDEIHPIDELGIVDSESWAFQHTIVELSTAIKPFLLKHLLSRANCEKVLYFDPDMVLFSRVDDILAALDRASIALTPHQTTPERTLEAVIDNEICSLKHGVFNLGFIGVKPDEEGRVFADWWAERVYHFCRADIPNGLFTDQKWIDLVPAFFSRVEIIRSPRHNVATWNLTTRDMVGSVEGGLAVNGEPLGFYHFTGFDSGAHKVMAQKNAGDNKSVQQLIEWYSRATMKDKADPMSSVPWAFAKFSDGTAVAAEHRRTYRERSDLRSAFPNPFGTEPDGNSYLLWCKTQGAIEYPERFGKKNA